MMHNFFFRTTNTPNAQADLSLRWAHTSEGTSSHYAALLYIQSTLYISTSLISNNRLYRSKILEFTGVYIIFLIFTKKTKIVGTL